MHHAVKWFSNNVKRALALLRPSPFGKLSKSFEKRLPAWEMLPVVPARPIKPVLILVTPWLGTPVPFFSMEVAFRLRSLGIPVRLVWDDLKFCDNTSREECRPLEALLKRLPADLPVDRVSDYPPTPASDNAADDALVERILNELAIWMERGESTATGFARRFPRAHADIRGHLGRVGAAISKHDPAWILIPNGFYGVSPTWVAAARRLGVSFTTFDCGRKTLIISHDEIAGHHLGVAAAFDKVEANSSVEAMDRAVAQAEHELAQRQGGGGRNFSWQVVAAGGIQERCDVLVPLNVRWDAAALGVQRLFPTVEAWVEAILQWTARQPEPVRVCFRQHPVERMAGNSSYDDIGQIVARSGLPPERVRFIAATEQINSYDLLRNCRAVLPHTSSIGVEAAFLGKTVLTSTNCYYKSAPFVWNSQTPEQYFATLDRAVAGELSVTPTQQRQAALVYFLTQFCAIMPTPFNPMPLMFAQWSEIEPTELWQRDELCDLTTALVERLPLAWVRFQRLTQS